MRSDRRLPVAVLLLALGVRVAPALAHRFASERVTVVDSAAYLELASALRDGRFARAAPPPAGEHGAAPDQTGGLDENLGAGVEIFRTPGYPLFLAALGVTDSSRARVVIAAQMLLGTLAAGLGALAAAELFGPAALLPAGILLALDPSAIVTENLVLSDALFLAMFHLSIWLALRSRAGTGAASWVASAAAWTAAAAVRPVAILAAPVLALILRRRGASWRSLGAWLAIALSFPIGWTVRNGLTSGVWEVSTAFDHNAVLVAVPRIRSIAERRPRPEAEREVVAQVAAASAGLRPAEAAKLRRAFLVDEIRRHPGAAIIAAARASVELLAGIERRYLLRMLGGEADGPSFGESGAARRITPVEIAALVPQVVLSIALLCGAALGLLHLARSGQVREALLLLLLLASLLGPALVVANGRHRLPASLVLAALAGLGWSSSRKGKPGA